MLQKQTMNNSTTTYKRLGDYIREVDVRNRDLQCTNLLGLSIAKTFIPSIANTVGTDFRPYKIVKHNQFAYVPVTSRNGDKITVALHEGQSDCIISQAYTSFEIKEVKELLPEYLMMWFRRPEFDRYARFKSHGSAREVFDWEEMCNVMLPIPSLEEQQRIVDRYNAIQHRIATNKQTIAKLEEAAQALYRKMFVDDIDPENLPEGWRMGTLGEVVEIKYGKDYKQLSKGNIPLYGSGGIMGFVNKSLYDGPSILIPRKGSLNNITLVTIPFWSVDTMFYSVLKINNALHYIYQYLKTIDFLSTDMGSAVPSMTTEHLNHMDLLIPSQDKLKEFEIIIDVIYTHCNIVKEENKKLTELLSLLMVEMG